MRLADKASDAKQSDDGETDAAGDDAYPDEASGDDGAPTQRLRRAPTRKAAPRVRKSSGPSRDGSDEDAG